jgi:hypothetical protein
LLEQQGEMAARSRPGHFDTFDAMFKTLCARDAGMQITMVLKEVQMPPGFVGKVVSLAGFTALWTRIEAATLCLDIEIQAMRRHGGIQVLILQVPWCFQAQAKR